MTKQKIIIGCGTGRCGTVSLSKLLSNCSNSNIPHEMKPIVSYDFNRMIYERFKFNILTNFKKYVGTVAPYARNVIEYLINDFPDIKIIWITRDREKTIKSFIKATEEHNLWSNDCKHPFGEAVPSYNELTREEAIKKFVNEENNRAIKLENDYPNNFKIFNVEDLNTKEGQNKIFDWVGIEQEDRNYLDDCRYNQVLNQ